MESKRSPALTKLTRVLARLFPTIESSKWIVANAHMEGIEIDYSNASLYNWMNIIDASLRQGKFDHLITFAIKECQEERRPQLQALHTPIPTAIMTGPVIGRTGTRNCNEAAARPLFCWLPVRQSGKMLVHPGIIGGQ